MGKEPSLKILVGYHKPAKLYKSDIYVPIHLGRTLATEASKDSRMSKDDYQWMLDNMIGDDTGDNISSMNERFAELTGIYWAWKNYDKLGNPDYIGFCHYRRLFSHEDIKSAINYDISAVKETFSDKTIKEQWQQNHPEDVLQQGISNLLKFDPSYQKAVFSTLKKKTCFHYNMFIMKKELFFEYCQMIFKILFNLDKKISYPKLSAYNQRVLVFLNERLTSIFIEYKHILGAKVKSCHCIFKEIEAKREILPAFEGKNSINICLSSDDNYAPFLAVTIQSIKEHADIKDYYDICILDSGISPYNQKRILSMQTGNIFIRFIPIGGYFADLNQKMFYIGGTITIATYNRFFIPQIFSNYKKILYLDCDMIINADLKNLFNTDLENKPLGACLDIDAVCLIEKNKCQNDSAFINYLQNTLRLSDIKKYFQAGVLLLDIPKLIDMDFMQKCLDKLNEIKKTYYSDQCVLNAVFNGNIKYLAPEWNVEWQTLYYQKDFINQLNVDLYATYMKIRENPKIIHYCGYIKPWVNPEVELANFWWKYARQTPFYEEILYKNLKVSSIQQMIQIANMDNSKNRFNYYRCKIMANLTFGKLRKHYKDKKKALETKIKEVRKFLKGK